MSKIPKLRFKEFIFPLELEKFGRVVKSNIYGPRFNANDYDENGNVKTIRGTDVYQNGEINYTQVPIAKIEENTIKTHRLEDGDLVMITTADCGLTGVFRKQIFDYICSAYAVKISLNEKGNPYYFKYFFQTKSAKNEISSYIRKATVANLPGSDILKIKVYLPPLHEQRKIANFLSAVDTKIDQLTRKKELLEQYKKGVMQKIFSQELRFKAEDGSEFSEWEEKTLGEIATFSKGKGISKADIAQDGSIECVTYGELYTTYSEAIREIKSKTNLEANQLVLSEYNDILIPASGETQIDIATASCILKSNVALGGDLNIIKSKMNGVFLSYYLKNKKKHDIAKLAQGVSVVHLYATQLKTLQLTLPSLDEQTKIANFLSVIDTKIDHVTQQLDVAKNFKKGLLQQMFV